MPPPPLKKMQSQHGQLSKLINCALGKKCVTYRKYVLILDRGWDLIKLFRQYRIGRKELEAVTEVVVERRKLFLTEKTFSYAYLI